MRDSRSKDRASIVEEAAESSETGHEVERERLVDDLAFLVVRQHRRELGTTSDTDLTPAGVGVGPE